ncbi:MAG: hypothetical protein JO061_12785, partial [Acidobacteriaceae bacterium]|nr:hypothetical protein [Acidobacteriaceae bacterium]
MLSRVHVMSTVVAALLAGYPLGAAINYTYTTLDYPGAQQTNATGINSAGQIVGTYVSGNVTHGFLYNPTSNPQFTTIDPPGSTGTTPSSIDDSGNVYGVFNSTGAFKYSIASAQYTTLASPTNLTTYYLSYVTANGIIIGN